jgi:hypothetical protein
MARLGRSWLMRIKEENRDMFLLGAVALCCTVLAGAVALFEPVVGQAPAKQVADIRPIEASALEPVRVVGAPFAPNTNPRER